MTPLELGRCSQCRLAPLTRYKQCHATAECIKVSRPRYSLMVGFQFINYVQNQKLHEPSRPLFADSDKFINNPNNMRRFAENKVLTSDH